MRKFLLIIYGLPFMLEAQVVTQPLDAGWIFRNTRENTWYGAEVPGTVHTDLLRADKIPDPFIGDNEKKVQWVEHENWEYKAHFVTPVEIRNRNHIELVFEGLDTYAKIFFNNKLLLETDNMFRAWRINVKALLKDSNELRIVFRSAGKHDDSLATHSRIRLAGENNRMYSRKAQYQYGWDWGPRLVTCGIWKPVRWEAWDEMPPADAARPKRWDVELIDKPDSSGRAFYFTMNGQPVYIKGANWIPPESFMPRAKKLELYRSLLSAARDAHINMLRVWGGGVYEDDEFYDLCDEYGIMVWQDFMFAGALYPADKKFLSNVEEEVRYQVKRLKRHPCIVLWCGNNEIEEAWNNWGWQKQYNYSPADSARLWLDYQKIFHILIPGILRELDPDRAYWPSSPSLGWGREEAYRQGDVHYWGVWWGREPVEKYNEKVGRFNSEYGMQGFPDMKTIRAFAGPGELDSSMAVMKTHQKHPFGYANIKQYIDNKFRVPKTFEDLVYVSQLMQADAMRTAIEAHRRNKPYNMGTLFWQWNDCWPVVSWSAVDYFGRKKALYYETRRSFAPELLCIKPGKGPELEWVFVTDQSRVTDLVIEAEAYDFRGQRMSPLLRYGPFTAEGGQPLTSRHPAQFNQKHEWENVFWVFRALSRGTELARTVYFFNPPVKLNLPRPQIRWDIVNGQFLELSSDTFAYGVFVDLPDGTEARDNFFHLIPGEVKRIQLSGISDIENLRRQIKVRSLAETY
ncbi:MAG: beta-mannosidase [Chitinophagaceae bacterium]